MKYLKRFNESSYQYLSEVRNNCNDILLDLDDKGIKYEIYGFEGVQMGSRHSKDSYVADMIRIEIGDERKTVKLKEFELELEHLLSYLTGEGFKLSGNSYCENDSWDYYECCPECGSVDLTLPDLNRLDGWVCNKCKHEGYQDNFQSPEHPVTMKDLKWFIKNNYYVQFMSLSFYKPR
jgi:hypothetical protein